MGRFGTVNRVSELLGGRGLRIVGTQVDVLRLVAVGAPIAFEFTAVQVENRHPPVAVAIGNIDLVVGRIDRHFRYATESLGIVAALTGARFAYLGQELAAASELEDVSVLAAVAADPNVVLVIDVTPWFELGQS